MDQNNKEVQCKICKLMFSDKNSLLLHKVTHKRETISFREKKTTNKMQKDSPEKSVLKCKCCTKKFKDATNLRAHELLHSAPSKISTKKEKLSTITADRQINFKNEKGEEKVSVVKAMQSCTMTPGRKHLVPNRGVYVNSKLTSVLRGKK